MKVTRYRTISALEWAQCITEADRERLKSVVFEHNVMVANELRKAKSADLTEWMSSPRRMAWLARQK